METGVKEVTLAPVPNRARQTRTDDSGGCRDSWDQSRHTSHRRSPRQRCLALDILLSRRRSPQGFHLVEMARLRHRE